MSHSFALILNKNMNFKKLIQETSSYYGFKFMNFNENNASAIHFEKQFTLDISPYKMHFLFPEEMNKENFEEVVDITRTFLTKNFSDQVIGIKYYNPVDKDFMNNINGVKTITI